MNGNVKRLAVANGPNIFQMLLVMTCYCFAAHADTIRSVMSNISLPESCFPAWAKVIPEGEWKAKLVSQISGSVDDNTVSSYTDDSDIVSTDNSCRQDVQDS